MTWALDVWSWCGITPRRDFTRLILIEWLYMQDRSKLGTRFTCYECGKKFYDLNKPEPVCPGCGANQLEDPTPDPRVAVMERYKGSRLTAKDAAPSKAAFKVDETETVEASADDADADEALDLDETATDDTGAAESEEPAE